MELLQFSATSLQDYVECHRRFQLRHLWEVAWPAPETDAPGEQEANARRGRELHSLIHQHLSGLPAETLADSARDPQLDRWWRSFLAYAPQLVNARVIPEVTLSTSLSGHRLMARYDALAICRRASAGLPPFTIFDWKTFRRRPARQWLADRLQTRVYPLVLVQAGARMNDGQPIAAGDVEMRYWWAEHATQVDTFAYSEARYQSDVDAVGDLIRQVVRRLDAANADSGTDEPWTLTDNWQCCRFCAYRSLCKRGAVGGPLEDYAQSDDLSEEAPLSPDEHAAHGGQIQDMLY
jgi:PD-(D/E)XK nuclease superfamily